MQARASSFQDDSKAPDAAIDGDVETRWCAADGSAPQWFQVDLDRPEKLTGCRIVWEHDEAPYYYKLESSSDGKVWKLLVDATRSTDRHQARVHEFQEPDVRHVRLLVTEVADGHWSSLCEFEIFGTRPAPAVSGQARKTTDPLVLLKEVKVPAGFDATIFAAPPDVTYPTCLTASLGGEVYVGIDENGSLDAQANRGRVVRCVDTNQDGVADQFNVFATMDSPRGLVWDNGSLYVLHPPNLSVFQDTDGDGAADRSEVLVSNIGFDLQYRGADHTTNGIRLGIDGFLYIAVGDYGFVRAQGKDGPSLTMLGGGIARVRTDGTGLAIVSRGQRNIYDVAIDPKLNLFTRDNTNDGDGWDVRLSHVVSTANYGYPSLFKRFSSEILAPLADYGGGSPCGSIFVQEPGFPAGFGDTLYTCEWGRGAVFMHPLQPRGASFTADQATFVTMPRPTDIDVDGSGQIFVSSWRDGGFTHSKANIGYVLRVVPPAFQPKPPADLVHADSATLVRNILAESSVLRLAAQRELLRRGPDKPAIQALQAVIEAAEGPVNGRVAAIFTLAQGGGPQADDVLNKVMKSSPDLREFAITALGDRRRTAGLPDDVAGGIDQSLTDPAPRVRLAAVIAAGRLAMTNSAVKILHLTADHDPVVAHAAVKALVTLRATRVCLDAFAGGTKAEIPGAALALQEMHDDDIIAPLAAIASNSANAGAQKAALQVLCRLYFTEAPYQQGHWWGTRPDTSGPYYKPITWSGSPAVGAAIRAALTQADPALRRWLINEVLRNKLDFEDLTALAVQFAEDDPGLRAALVDLMTSRTTLSSDTINFLEETATRGSEADPVQVRAIRGLLKHQNQPEARAAAMRSLARNMAKPNPGNDLVGLLTEYARDNRHLRDLGAFGKLAEDSDASAGTLGYAVLLAAAANGKAPEAARNQANAAIDRGWDRSAWTPRLLRAIGLVRSPLDNERIRPLLSSTQVEIRQAAEFAAERLNLTSATSGTAAGTGKPIAANTYEAVLAATLADQGDSALGTQLFGRIGCVNCHAITKSGPLKGPYLGDVAARYNRAELVESILKPSARIAQGFETQKLALTDGRLLEGFVVREAGDEVELRNSAGNVVVVPKADIEERGKSELSVMPVGLLDPLTPHDLASLLAYLDSIKGH